MKIPLLLRLKKEAHREIAKAQDLIVEALYQIFERAVLHGGTCIWRCFNGNRFSEDVDVYIIKDKNKLESLFKAFGKKGFIIKKKKISEKSIYSSLDFNGTIVRFEALFKRLDGNLTEYEKADGTLMTIYSLNAEQLIKEKVETYIKRQKIRDLYDIFFLLRYIKDKTTIKSQLKMLIDNFKEPVDEKDLRVIILEGIVPEKEAMFSYIKRFI